MKNLMVVNVQPSGKRGADYLLRLVEAQITNSLELGWHTSDILIVSNVDFSFSGIRPLRLTLNSTCLRGSKVFALRALHLAGEIHPDEVYWAHDLDAWQNHWFDAPEFKHVALAEYSRPKYNGGSVFYRCAAADIIEAVTQEIQNSCANREEPTLNRLLRSEHFKHRVTTLNHTFNVGCSGFVERYERSSKPILVSHFHPTNSIAWDTHVNDRNETGEIAISSRLRNLLVDIFHGGIPPRKLIRSKC